MTSRIKVFELNLVLSWTDGVHSNSHCNRREQVQFLKFPDKNVRAWLFCSGVGFGICQRLLFQLCQQSPPDALPQQIQVASDIKLNERGPVAYKGITLIMACRNRTRAEAARTKLLLWLEGQVSLLSSRPDDNGHARAFHSQCNVQIHELDLASIKSVLRFVATMREK